MAELSKEVEAGQAVYSRRVLFIYDVWVLGVSSRWIWRCPSGDLLAAYDRHVSGNHLDVGVGTGYFLDKCRFPTESPRVALMDLNRNSLRASARRIGRYAPTCYQRNVAEPVAFSDPKFDSIGMNYLLHCMPGDLAEKSVVFDHLSALLNPGGVIFGATLLSEGVQRNAVAKRLMRLYNDKGIFSNVADSLEDLEEALSSRFSESQIQVRGAVALFWGRV